MSTLFPVAGLALDLIGAFFVAIGLFARSRPLLPGYARDPLQAANEQAYGGIGFLSLACGFTMQPLPSFGAAWSGSSQQAAVLALLTLSFGLLLARLLQQVALKFLHDREKTYVNRHDPTNWPHSLEFAPHRWRWIRLWKLAP